MAAGQQGFQLAFDSFEAGTDRYVCVGRDFDDGQLGRVKDPRERGALWDVRLSAVLDPPEGGSVEATIHFRCKTGV